MLPGLNFEALAAGKEKPKGKELFSSHQVVEGSSERLFQNFSFGGGRAKLGNFPNLADAYWFSGQSSWPAVGGTACDALPPLTINPENPWRGRLSQPIVSWREKTEPPLWLARGARQSR